MKPAFLIIILLCFFSCKKKKSIDWDDAHFDGKISADSVYQQLNAQKEILAVYEHDTSMRRTNDVIYKIDRGGTDDTKSSKFYNCRAYYVNPEILTINIGLSSGIRGEGFVINYSDGKFYTEPYSYMDPGKKKEVTYKINNQTLTLNKQQYSIGDSLYGKIDFNVLEMSGNREIKHTANGFFRTKIGKPN